MLRLVPLRAACLATALGITLAAHARIPAPSPAEAGGRAVVPRPELIRVVALGFESLLADYYWLRAVQLVGGEDRNPVRHAPAIGRLAGAVTTLDPFVDHPYRFAALWMGEHPESLPAVNRILERGIAYHPREWRNRFYLSFNHLFYLGDASAAAAELEGAIHLPGAPAYLGRLLARLRSVGGDLDAASAYLRMLLENEDLGLWHRLAYEEALLEIETERRARQLDEARARFQRENGFDIERVEELAWGPHAVIWTLPAEPNGAGWTIDERTGQIVSKHYLRRYQVNFANPAQKIGASPSDPDPAGGGKG